MKALWFEASGFKADFEAVLVEPWSPYVGAVQLLCYLLVHYNETTEKFTVV
jgi:hypothetical protein